MVGLRVGWLLPFQVLKEGKQVVVELGGIFVSDLAHFCNDGVGFHWSFSISFSGITMSLKRARANTLNLLESLFVAGFKNEAFLSRKVGKRRSRNRRYQREQKYDSTHHKLRP